MRINIERALIEQKMVLRQLIELYHYDFSEFDLDDVNEHGLYGYKYLDHYWTDTNRIPFLIKVNNHYAGFALVRKIVNQGSNQESYYSMAEFFIMKKYRKSGVGKHTAFFLFDMFKGKWEVSEIEENIPAQKFWKKIIAGYTCGNYQDIKREDWPGPIQSFTS